MSPVLLWKGSGNRIMVHIDLLPTEIIERVLYALDLRSLLTCRQVNRHMQEVIDKSVLLQYKIELDVAGMVDGAPSDVSMAERLERVRKHTNSWSRLAFATVEELPCRDAHMVQLSGKVLARCVGDSTLAFSVLPGHARGVRSKEWRIENVGFPIKAYAIDPAQDLIAILSDSQPPAIYLWSISTGEPHPLATDTQMSFPHGREYDMDDRFDLCLTGDFLGVRCPPMDGEFTKELIVWSWKNGTVCFWMSNLDAHYGYAFLRDYLLLAPQLGMAYSPRIEVYEIHTRRICYRPVLWEGDGYCCALIYPPYEHRFLSWQIQRFRYPSEDQGEGVFRPSFSEEYVVLEMAYDKMRSSVGEEDVDDGHGDYHLELTHVIPATVILSRIQHSISHPGSQKMWPWEDWGAASTFMTGPFQSYGTASRRQPMAAGRSIEWPPSMHRGLHPSSITRDTALLHDFRARRFRRELREGALQVHAAFKASDQEMWINRTQFLECAMAERRLPSLVTRYKGCQWDIAITEDNLLLIYDCYPCTECYVMSI